MRNTRLLMETLDIQYPILQGGMAWVATGKLAAAVSEAGGLGMIGAGNAPPDVIEEEIHKIRRATQRNFGVNLMLLSPFVEQMVDLVVQEQVPVVTTGAGNPAKYMDKLKQAGIKVIPVIPSVALAKRMEKQNVDALIVEGTEAGGHIGEQTTMALLPQIVDAVSVPVVAAGGIADGRGLTAALALGAAGIQMGTRFVLCQECTAHKNYKNAIRKAKDRDTVVTARSTGRPVRSIKNKLTKEFLRQEEAKATLEELEELGAGALSRAVNQGDIDQGSVMAGQISGLIHEEKTAEAIIQEIVVEAREVMNTLDPGLLERQGD